MNAFPAAARPVPRLGRLARVEEALAASGLAVEIVVLLAGVLARYLFARPLLWTEELATTLFLWIAMLGAAIAQRRGTHMRIAIVARVASLQLRARMESIAEALVLVLVLTLVVAGIEGARAEAFITTPALQISGAWRAAAIPAGCFLMLVHQLADLALRPGGPRLQVIGMALGLALLALMLAQFPESFPSGFGVAVTLGLLVVALLCGVPIAFAFGVGAAIYLLTATDAPLLVIPNRMADGMSHLTLLAIPLFICLGALLEASGLAESLIAFLASLLGHLRGGLSLSLVGAMFLVSGISGSKGADMAAIAPALFPRMKARGADGPELVALLAATGAQTETIPPSLVLITLGSVAGVSIASLFTGGVLPAAVVGALLAAAVVLRAPSGSAALAPWSGWAEVRRSFFAALPTLALPVLIRLAVVRGIATATEVATLGILYVLILGVLVYRALSLRQVRTTLVEAATLSGAILFIIGGATALAWCVVRSGLAASLAQSMSHLPGGVWAFLAVSIGVFVVFGSLLEGIPAVVLLAPLLFPAAHALGIHPVHYAMVVVLSLGVGLFAPPLGVGYYTACAIGGVEPAQAAGRIWAYLWPVALGVLIVAAVPWLSTGFL